MGFAAGRWFGLAALLAAPAGAAQPQPGTSGPPAQVAPAAAPAAAAPAPAAAAPSFLGSRLRQLGSAFDGQAGIAVRSVEQGWTAGWNPDLLCPQQSVSKLWVAITALDAVDRGKVRLTDTVTLNRSDLTLFHQPIAARILGGGRPIALGELMHQAITKSDNTANDKLMRAVGGPEAVRAMIAAKKLGAIRFYDGERALQSRIAGLVWSQGYSIGDAFYKARGALPYGVRKASFDRYLADPFDGARPDAIVEALARLKRGELLAPASTARLLAIMGNTKTGPRRLKGGLKPGWSLAHKTGTGQVLRSTQAGYNDIGILTAPNGRSYAVAVMIKSTATPLATRMTLMNNVVRAVIETHELGGGSPYTL